MSIRDLVIKHNAQKVDRDADYCDAYERQFAGMRDSVKNVIEIGVKDGGSVRMWEEYFPNAEIIGIDIDPGCKIHEKGRVKIIIADQSDAKANYDIRNSSGMQDIIIDDGSHVVIDQFVTFLTLFRLVRPGGVYVIEDLHTSYWPHFGGGRKTYHVMTRLIDMLHARHWKQNKRAKDLSVDKPVLELEKSIKSIHFYDSICFIEKAKEV